MVDDIRILRIEDTNETVAVIDGLTIDGTNLDLDEANTEALLNASMYESWTEPKRKHFKLTHARKSPVARVAPNNRRLMIFDTWGTSSYYHLLIDHVIPLWMTREVVKSRLPEFKKFENISYYRISDHGYPGELGTAQEIFEHFLGKPFRDHICGNFDSAVYGYLFRHRPYHGPNYPNRTFESYGSLLRDFRKSFCAQGTSKEKYILVPERLDRLQPFVSSFTESHANMFNFRFVDFSKMSISEQIETCSNAYAIFGAEGAAFANQVFLPDGSLCIPVCQEPDRFHFHENLARYCGHDFIPIRPTFFNGGRIKSLVKRALLGHAAST